LAVLQSEQRIAKVSWSSHDPGCSPCGTLQASNRDRCRPGNPENKIEQTTKTYLSCGPCFEAKARFERIVQANEVLSKKDSRARQGLQLAHYSAQLEPCMTREKTLHTLNTP
jgi:hypothetical protein